MVKEIPNQLEMFTTKSGTRDVGPEYEDKMTAYFSLLLAQDPKVKDFHISSNNPNYGNFDDLVMQVDSYKNKENEGDGNENEVQRETVAIQLKHQHEGKQLSGGSFSSEKNDFSLIKYFKETDKMKIPEEVSLVLLTNRTFGIDRKHKEFEIKTTVDDNEVKLQLEIFEPVMEAQPAIIRNIKSNTHSKIFQFKITGEDNFEKFEFFLKRFYFFSNGDDVKVMEVKLREQFLQQETYEQFKKFVENWSKETKKYKLNKETVMAKFMECLISPYALTSRGEIRGQSFLFEKLFLKFEVTILEDSFPLVEGYDNNFVEEKMKEKENTIWKEEKQFGLSKKTDAVKLLWHLNELPLIIKTDFCPKNVLSKVLNLGKSEYFRRRFVVVGKTDGDFKERKVLRNLSDFRERLADYSDEEKIVDLPEELETDNGEELKVNFFEEVKDDGEDEELKKCLMKVKLNLQGRERLILDFVKNDKELSKLFSVKDIASVIIEKKTISLGENIRDIFPYINRLLQKPVISSEILKELPASDIVVVNCQGRESALRNQDNFQESERIILYENSCSAQEFQEICSKHQNENIHHLQVTEKNNLSWITSTGKIENLMKYLSEQKDEAVSDSEIFTKFRNPTILLCADPGMGKSVLMEFLVHNCPRNVWPIVVNIREYAKIFTKTPEEILEEIIQKKYKDDLTKAVVDLMKNQNRILLLFDGVDEASQNDLPNIFKALKSFSDTNYPHWVTSRNHLKTQLEKELQVFALTLSQLDEDNQKYYIRNRLNCDKQRESEIMTQLKNSLHREILGIPLQLFMLTEIYKSDENHQDLTLNDMYSKFVDMKFKACDSKITTPQEESLYEQQKKQYHRNLVRDYQKAGVLTCFQKKYLTELNVDPEELELVREVKENGDKIGLVVGLVEDFIPVFIHQTYAEHFCALFLKENFRKIGSFLSNVLAANSEYQTIRFMLDMMLANGSKAHLAIFYKNLEMIKESDSIPKDLLGRTPADLACIYDNSEKYQELSQSGHEVTFNLRKWGTNSKEKKVPTEFYSEAFDLFKHSEAIKSLFPLEILLRVKNSEENQKRIRSSKIFRNHICSFTLSCIRNNYEKLFLLLDEIPSIKIKTVVAGSPVEKNNTLLHFAASFGDNGNGKIVNTLLEKETDINSKNQNGNTALMMACKNGNQDFVVSLLKKGAEVNACNNDDDTSLLQASLKGHKEIVLTLIKEGAKVNARSKDGNTAMLNAFVGGHKDIVVILLENGAEVNACNSKNETALMNASRWGFEEIVSKLVDAGAEVNATDINNETALLKASHRQHMKIVLSLLEKGAEVNACNKNGDTVLLKTSQWGHKKIVLKLLERNVKVNHSNNIGDTALLTACQGGHLEIAKNLIKNGAYVNAKNKEGDTALLKAYQRDCEDFVLFLIDKGADVNAENITGGTALERACRWGHKKIVLDLIDRKADVDNVNHWGETPLFGTAIRGYKDIVQILVDNGADVNFKNTFDESPLMFASLAGHKDVVEILIEGGAKVEDRTIGGDTSLLVASCNGLTDVVKVLIERGADINCHNVNGDSPLFLASREGHEDVKKILLENGAVELEVPKGMSSLILKIFIVSLFPVILGMVLVYLFAV